MRNLPEQLAAIDPPPFTPVAYRQSRHDGWTAQRQEQFVTALCVLGSYGAALKVVKLSRPSLTKLRQRADAGSFIAACDMAIEIGRDRAFTVAMDRALNGVTSITISPTGGRLTVSHSHDMAQLNGAMRDPARP
jgi:hypothetical protein